MIPLDCIQIRRTSSNEIIVDISMEVRASFEYSVIKSVPRSVINEESLRLAFTLWYTVYGNINDSVKRALNEYHKLEGAFPSGLGHQGAELHKVLSELETVLSYDTIADLLRSKIQRLYDNSAI